MRVADIDWAGWMPDQRATLLFVVRGGEALMIRKKRGLGAGKINAPGGRIEAGETPLEGALREIHEEVGVVVDTARELGQLSFQFVDGLKLFCHVFRADGCAGAPHETEEAIPYWLPVDALPYGEMWADDALWVPWLLAERPFEGRFVFDGDTMVDHRLDAWHAAGRGA